jgi:phosphoribosyl-AMP cyclohydrolase
MIELDFKKGGGLLPAVVQDHASGKVLMLAYINQASWEKPWRPAKPTTGADPAGNLAQGRNLRACAEDQRIFVDCDNDTVLLSVEQVGGAACHAGYESCFYRKIGPEGPSPSWAKKVFDPERVYKK